MSYEEAQSLSRREILDKLEELGALLLTKVKVPKGFENFLPKNARTGNQGGSDGGGGDDDDGNDDSNEDDSSKDDKKAQGGDKATSTASKEKTTASADGGGGGSGGHKSGKDSKKNKRQKDEERRQKKAKDEEMQQQLAGTFVLLLLVLAARSFLDGDAPALGQGDGPEVTWSDFYNYMLTEGDVARIVVVNKKTARVYLRPGARGVPAAAGPRGGALARARSAMGMAGGMSPPGAAPPRSHSDEWDDGTVMEMSGGGTDPSLGGAAPRGLDGLNGGGGGGRPAPPLVYHFNIGSVESFEDKLARSQQELGTRPRDYVPVQYASETNWADRKSVV